MWLLQVLLSDRPRYLDTSQTEIAPTEHHWVLGLWWEMRNERSPNLTNMWGFTLDNEILRWSWSINLYNCSQRIVYKTPHPSPRETLSWRCLSWTFPVTMSAVLQELQILLQTACWILKWTRSKNVKSFLWTIDLLDQTIWLQSPVAYIMNFPVLTLK